MESVKDFLDLVSNILTALAVLIGAGLGVLVFAQLTPVLSLRIRPIWGGKKPEWLILRIEIENKSRVRLHKEAIYLQVLEYEMPEGSSLSGYVPFQKPNDEEVSEEQPIEWHPPIKIFRSTLTIDSNEVLTSERLYHHPRNSVLKVGVQVRGKLGPVGSLAAHVRGYPLQWTTTRIIMRQTEQDVH